MSDEKIILQIELEDGQILKALGAIKKQAGESGKALEQSLQGKGIKDFNSALDGLVGQLPATRAFGNVVAAIPLQFKLAGAAAVVAGVAFKEALDATLAGEKVNSIATQFEVLTNNVGIAGLALKQEFIDKAGGLVQTDDLTKALNKSIIEMGSSAQRLGPIFDIALKATTVFGGTAVQNFEAMSTAIATGNTRSLKNLGIIIDTDAVYKKFAETLGITADKLSLAGKQQALLSAVSEQGNKAFAGIEPTALQATAAFSRFSNATTDLGQAIQSIVATALGPSFAALFNSIASAVNSAADSLVARFGSGIDQTIAKQSVLKAEMKSLEEQILSLQSVTNNGILKNQEPFIDALRAKLSGLRVEASAAQEALDRAEMTKAKQPSGDNSSFIEQTVKAEEDKRRTVLAQERLKTRESILAQQMQFETDDATRQAIASAQKQLLIEQEALALLELDRRYKEADLIDSRSHEEAKLLIQQQFAQRRVDVERSAAAKQKQELNSLNAAFNQTLSQGISSAVQSFTKAIISGQFTLEKFSKSMLGIIGDMAIQIGTMVIATDIAKLALLGAPGSGLLAGAALIAIGTVLKSYSGAESGASTGGIGSIGGGSGGSVGGSEATQVADLQRDSPATNVTVNVNGNVFDRRSTGLEIANIIAESFDANGTRIIGGATA